MKKRFLLVLIALFSISVSAFAKSDQFEKKRVAVIPVDEAPELTPVIENSLAADKRFEFIDKKLIPQVLKEWERRQTGMTDEDDTSELYIKNIAYLVTITNVNIDTEFVQPKNAPGYWSSTVKAQIKVTYVQEGGIVAIQPISASASDADQFRSRKNAIAGLNSSIVVAFKRLFPIEAIVYESDFTSVKILRGKETGIEEGQRYILKEKRVINAGGKKVTSSKEMAFVRITDVNDNDSSGYIISGTSDFDINNTIAHEKYYTGIAFELYGGAVNYNMEEYAGLEHDFGDYDAMYGFKLLFGDNLQFGWGMNFDMPGPGRFNRFSVTDLSLRYNFHIIRRLYFIVEGGGSFDFALTDEYIRTKSGIGTPSAVPDIHGAYIYEDWDKETLYSWTISGYASAGFKFITGQNSYVFVTGGYVLAGKFKDWTLSKPKESDTEEAKMEVINDTIDTYDNYVERFSPGGIKMQFGVGFYF